MIDLSLSNASARPMSVDPFFGSGPETELSVRLEVEDCTLYRPPFTDVSEPAVLVWLTEGRSGHAFGTDPVVLQRLSEVACGDGDVRGAVVTPLSADEQQVAEDAADQAISVRYGR